MSKYKDTTIWNPYHLFKYVHISIPKFLGFIRYCYGCCKSITLRMSIYGFFQRLVLMKIMSMNDNF